MTEILIYGLPAGETRAYCEDLLSTQCKTLADIEAVKTAASAAGFHSFRIAYYNGEKPDFENAISL
jgi:hypothetical protein